jgi:hypothetical protein
MWSWYDICLNFLTTLTLLSQTYVLFLIRCKSAESMEEFKKFMYPIVISQILFLAEQIQSLDIRHAIYYRFWCDFVSNMPRSHICDSNWWNRFLFRTRVLRNNGKIVLCVIFIIKIKTGVIFFMGVEMIASQCNSIMYRFVIIRVKKDLYHVFMSKKFQIGLILFDFLVAVGLSYWFYSSIFTIEVCWIGYVIKNHILGS